MASGMSAVWSPILLRVIVVVVEVVGQAVMAATVAVRMAVLAVLGEMSQLGLVSLLQRLTVAEAVVVAQTDKRHQVVVVRLEVAAVGLVLPIVTVQQAQ